MDFHVDLNIFRGPLDLLLYLVRKHEVEIVDIPIALITEQYLQYLEETDSSPNRWNKLRTGRPSGIEFWYRQANQRFVHVFLPPRKLTDRTPASHWLPPGRRGTFWHSLPEPVPLIVAAR